MSWDDFVRIPHLYLSPVRLKQFIYIWLIWSVYRT